MTARLVILFSMLLLPSVGRAQTGAPQLPDAYCGISAAYALLKLRGVELDFKTLLDPKFVDSYQGSSARALVGLLQGFGTHSAAMKGLRMRDLQRGAGPVLLHVRSSSESKEFDHWIVYLRTDGASVYVLDAGGGVDVLSTGALSARWNGTAIVPSDVAARIQARPMWERVSGYWIACGALIVALIAWRVMTRRRNVTGRSIKHGIAAAMGMLAATFGLGLALGMTTSNGLLASPEVVRRVQDASIGTFISRIDQSQLRQWVSGGDVLLIDTRSPADFSRGHIEGAINLPVFLSSDQLAEALRDQRRDRRIVLYCLSERCSYANEVAGRLWRLGHQNLAVYEKGMRDWRGER